MRTLRRNCNRTIYVCPRISTNEGVELFGSPKELNLYLEPVTNKTDIGVGVSGENHEYYLKGIVTHLERVGVEARARVYVDRKPPVKHDVLCREADYVIDNQFDYLSHRVIVLKRLSGSL